ncbi:MAG: hypothetical protein QM777_21995 [Pseudorhodoferax sp.]
MKTTRGDLVELLPRLAVDARESIGAVHGRNTQPATRIACFLDFLAERLVAPA